MRRKSSVNRAPDSTNASDDTRSARVEAADDDNDEYNFDDDADEDDAGSLRLPTVSDKNGEKNNNNAVNADRNKSMDDTLEADDHSPDGFDEGDEFAMMDEEEEPIDEMAAEQDRKRRKSDSGNSSIGTVSSSTSAAVALDMRVGREKKEVAKPEEDGQTNPNYLSVPKPKRYRRSKAAIKMDQEKTACMICGDKASGCHYRYIIFLLLKEICIDFFLFLFLSPRSLIGDVQH